MALLVVGLILWVGAHLFKRVASAQRQALTARMGDGARGLVAGLILASVVLMVLGYRAAEFVPVYAPLAGMGHLNNLLMLVAVFLYGVGGTKGTLYPLMRHPMLWGTVVWAVAHLLVNGDAASVLLFGGIGVWALLEMVLINRAGGWTAPRGGRGIKGDAMNLVGVLVIYGLISGVHIWTGHNPFVGNY